MKENEEDRREVLNIERMIAVNMLRHIILPCN